MTTDQPAPPTAEFGFPGPQREAPVAAILAGSKTSTTSLAQEYEPGSHPRVRDRSVLVDSAGRPVAVLEVTAVCVVALADVDLDHARHEGEGFESVAQWRGAHERFWHGAQMQAEHPGLSVTDTTPVVLERFRVVPA